MRIVIVGSVAAGTSVGAKARRNSEEVQIVGYERDRHISYSGCGLPYFLGGEVEQLDELTPRDPAWFAKRYRMDVRTGQEVIAIDPSQRSISVLDLSNGSGYQDTYDELVLATGARSVRPPIPGIDAAGIFALRTPSDAAAIRTWIEEQNVRRAVIVGGGYIGLEVVEQLVHRGIHVTLVERLDQVMPSFDREMAARVAVQLRANGVDLRLGAEVASFEGDPVAAALLADGTAMAADLVVVGAGVQPNVELAVSAGVPLGASGAIAVDDAMRTGVPHIWAVGDVAESYSLITGQPVWRPLGSTANKMGRIAGDAMTGGTLRHRGILGTGIFRVFDVAAAQTGLTEREARAAGYDIAVLHNIKPDRPEYLGGQEMIIKAIANARTGRLLGAQVVGRRGVDKRIDVLATAITFGANAADLFHLDLAYAPPFATTKDPVLSTGMALDNAVTGRAPLITPAELVARQGSGQALQIVDVRSAADRAKTFVPGSVHIPLGDLRRRLHTLDPAVPTVTYCNKGVSGNAGQNVLLRSGFRDVANLSGGNTNYQAYLALDQVPAP